jgi:glycosyltransferase involved in cell wall biosynthesis
MENLISIIIPSFNDKDLQKTVDDLRNKAEGEIEIITIENKPRREATNEGVAKSHGKYIMKCDAHCMFGQGYDRLLLTDIEDNWIVVPRRYKLDTDKWEVMDDRPIDYERLAIAPDRITGVEWKSRAKERKDIMIDENMMFQGSCWLMSRKHWDWLGGVSEVGYGSFTQEPEEIGLKTWLGGGKVMTNKLTWYAHKHRKFGRTIAGLTSSQHVKDGNAYSRDFWLNNKWDKRIHDFEWLMKRFGLEYSPAI